VLWLGLALEQAGGELRPISLLPASNLHSSQILVQWCCRY